MDPLSLALLGGGSTIVSSILGNNANDAVNAARAKVIAAERTRQQALDTEAQGVNNQSLGRYANFDQQQAADTARLADMFKAPVTTFNTAQTTNPLPATPSDLVARDLTNRNAIASNYVANQGDALANLRSFGDLMGTIGRGQAQDAQAVNQIGGFKKGSQAVEQLELDSANNAGNSYKALSDLFGGLGKVGLTAGLSGSFAPAAAAVKPAVGNLAASLAPNGSNVFASGATPFLTYGA
ncbi:hypothetical protein [Bradyrhizobium sp. 33ap4]|uniref:hypothetical protein n=1 Tax=Bradyrhizobium sp. 33ap4 TaxID=3061630 RepID=UPI0029312474|nr:hypothetical protein [Bradyrhizobium sp. 33ap4]